MQQFYAIIEKGDINDVEEILRCNLSLILVNEKKGWILQKLVYS